MVQTLAKLLRDAPWHKESFEVLMHERLPQLLGERLPLVAYSAEATSESAYTVHVALAGSSGVIQGKYRDVLGPNAQGVIPIDGTRRVVMPVATDRDLATARIKCVGDQLFDFIAARLGQAPDDLVWDEALLATWFPLNSWVTEFLRSWPYAPPTPPFDEVNWLERWAVLRRLAIPQHEHVFAPGDAGRTCPFMMPEGPNIYRLRAIARGAAIHDGRLVVVDERPEAGLSMVTALIPFLEHNDPSRLLMGSNMLRQWVAPPDPEPALVQTGNEPAENEAWLGRNLLTAYVSWGPDTHAYGIALSESAARRLGYPDPVEPGDKLSNRHGTKGVVARILPDDDMPHLADGTPVELVYSFLRGHTTLEFGDIREAMLSRVARAAGAPVVVPPYQAPSERELRDRLAAAGLPPSGMETLTRGKGGPPLARPSTVGWVYWGRLIHLAAGKLSAVADGSEGRSSGQPAPTNGDLAPRPQRQGEMEYWAYRDAGAFENIAECYSTRSAAREDAASLAARVMAGDVPQSGPPSPLFAQLARRLSAAGIRAELADSRLHFAFAQPAGEVLTLAQPVPHPWWPERALSAVGALPDLPSYRTLVETNGRVARFVADGVPESLTGRAMAQLASQVVTYFDDLLTNRHLWINSRSLFSGRAVIAPGADLRLDQVGLPAEIAWTLFGPLVARELGNGDDVRARTARAARVLDALMERSWVIINRAPTLTPTCLLAFHPVRLPDPVIRLHPLTCPLLNADFDGDTASVFLPITGAAQHEAGERLSVAGHLARDPGVLESLLPTQAALWGLADLSRSAEGRDEISMLAGADVAAPEGIVTREALLATMQAMLEKRGVAQTLEALERLMRRGFAVAGASGASINPFIGASIARPPVPTDGASESWDRYAEALQERLAGSQDYEDDNLGPQLLAVKSGTREGIAQLGRLVGSPGSVASVNGQATAIRRGLAKGLTPGEGYGLAVEQLEGIGRVVSSWGWVDLYAGGHAHLRETYKDPPGFTVLARAMRATWPGPVFAHAAATGETDPLTDVNSRVFVGLPPAYLTAAR